MEDAKSDRVPCKALSFGVKMAAASENLKLLLAAVTAVSSPLYVSATILDLISPVELMMLCDNARQQQQHQQQ